MDTSTFIWISVTLLVILGLIFWYFSGGGAALAPAMVPTSTPIVAGAAAESITLPGGVVSLSYPSGSYGLATAPEQVLVHPAVPPCDTPFDYCVYRTDSAYASTTFESAGVRAMRRPDLTSERTCLTAAPAGFANISATTSTTAAAYASSALGPVDQAAAGSYSQGAVYRLWAGGSCTEFETRIGEAQASNYPQGAVPSFTAEDRTVVQSELDAILASVRVSGTPATFPSVPGAGQ